MTYKRTYDKWLHLAASLLVVITITFLVFAKPMQRPTGDAPRYIVAAVNLLEHGVISRQSFDPSNIPKEQLPLGGPLVTWEIASAAAVSQKTRKSLICATKSENCSYSIPGLRALHVLELIIFTASGGILALWIFGSWAATWLTVVLILLCKQIYFGVELVLTEPLYLACVGLFLVSWYRWLLTPCSVGSALATGTTLSLTILVKPVYLPVMLLAPLGVTILVLWTSGLKRWRKLKWVCLLFSIPCFVLVVGYMGYHASFSGLWTLSDPLLLEGAIAHRVAYNAMTWNEWLAGWIYYLPDFGDSLSRRFINAEFWERLDLNNLNGFYIHGRDVLHSHVRELAVPKSATGILVTDYVLSNPFWHATTSLLLLWQGIFVGKLWGLIALPCLIWCLSRCHKNTQALKLLGLIAPVLVVAVIYSSCSVSIPRYNSGLIIPFALAVTWALRQILGNLISRVAQP